MATLQFKHPVTKAIITADWYADDDPTDDDLDAIVKQFDQQEQSFKAADQISKFSEGNYGLSPETGIPWRAPETKTFADVQRNVAGSMQDAFSQMPVSPEQLQFLREARKEEMEPPSFLKSMFTTDPNLLPAGTIEEAAQRKAMRELGNKEAMVPVHIATRPLEAAGKAVGYGAMKAGEMATLPFYGPMAERYQPSFEKSQDPLSMATEGWKEIGGLPEGVTNPNESVLGATPYGESPLAGMKAEEQNEWFKRNRLLGYTEMGGDLSLQLMAGLGAGGVGIGTGTLGKVARYAGWLIDPVNRAQFLVQEKAMARAQAASKLGLQDLPEVVAKQDAKDAAILSKVQELQAAAQSGADASQLEKAMGSAFLPLMGASAVEGLQVATDDSRSEQERAMGLLGFIQSAGFSGLALYHTLRTAKSPTALELVEDPVARQVVEKVVMAEDPAGAKQAIAALREEWAKAAEVKRAQAEQAAQAQAAADAQLEEFNKQLQPPPAPVEAPPPEVMTPPPTGEAMVPPPTESPRDAAIRQLREAQEAEVARAGQEPPPALEETGDVAPRPFRPTGPSEAEQAHADRVLSSNVGQKTVAVLKDVGGKLSQMMDRFRLSEWGRSKEHGKWAGFAPTPEDRPNVLGWAFFDNTGRAQSDVTTIAANVMGETRKMFEAGGRDMAQADPKLISHLFAERVVDHMIHEATHPLSRAGHAQEFWNPEDIRLTPEGEIDAPTHAEAFEEMFKAHKEALQKSGEYDALVKQIREDITAKDVQKLSDLRYEYETDKVTRKAAKETPEVAFEEGKDELEPPPKSFLERGLEKKLAARDLGKGDWQTVKPRDWTNLRGKPEAPAKVKDWVNEPPVPRQTKRVLTPEERARVEEVGGKEIPARETARAEALRTLHEAGMKERAEALQDPEYFAQVKAEHEASLKDLQEQRSMERINRAAQQKALKTPARPIEMRGRKGEAGFADVGALAPLAGGMVGGLTGFAYGGPVGGLIGAGVGALGVKALGDALAGVHAVRAAKSGAELKATEKKEEGRVMTSLRDAQSVWLSAVVGGKETVWRNVVQTVATGGLLGAVDFARGVSYMVGNHSDAAHDAFYKNLHRLSSIGNADYARLIGDTVRMSMKGVWEGAARTGIKKYRSLERLGKRSVDPDLQRQFELVMSGEVEIGGGKTRPLRPLERFARLMMVSNAAQERAFRYTILERELAPFMKREGLTADRKGYAQLYQMSKKDPALQSRLTAAMSKAENVALWRTKGLRAAPDSIAAGIVRVFDKVPLISRLMMQFPNYWLNNFVMNTIETNAVLQKAFDVFDPHAIAAPERSSKLAHERYSRLLEFTARNATGYEVARRELKAFRDEHGEAIKAAEAIDAQKRTGEQKKLLSDYGELRYETARKKIAWLEEQTNLRQHFKSGYYGKDFHTNLKLVGAGLMALGYATRMIRGDDKDSPFEFATGTDKNGKRTLKSIFPLLAEFSPMWLVGDWLARRKLGSTYYDEKSLRGHLAQVFTTGGRPIPNEGITDAINLLAAFKDEEGERSLRKIAANLGQQVGKLGAVGDVGRMFKSPETKTRPEVPVGGEVERFGGIPQSFGRGALSMYTSDPDKLTPAYDSTSGEIRKPLSFKEVLGNLGMMQRDQSAVARFLDEHPKAKKAFLRPVTGNVEWDKRIYGKMREALSTPYIKTDSGEKITIPQMLASKAYTDDQKESLLNTHLTKAMQGEQTEIEREALRKKDLSALPATEREKAAKYKEEFRMKRELRGESRHFPREAHPLRRGERMRLDELIPIPQATPETLTPPPTSGGQGGGEGQGGGPPSAKLLSDASRRHGVDEALIRAIVSVESAGKRFATSSAGARGYMQLMPATFKAFGGKDITNGWENIMVGTKYLKHLLEMFGGDVEKALAAYNAGPSRVRSGQPLPAETVKYVKKVMARYSAASGSTGL